MLINQKSMTTQVKKIKLNITNKLKVEDIYIHATDNSLIRHLRGHATYIRQTTAFAYG
jgi:hypothetical protein